METGCKCLHESQPCPCSEKIKGQKRERRLKLGKKTPPSHMHARHDCVKLLTLNLGMMMMQKQIGSYMRRSDFFYIASFQSRVTDIWMPVNGIKMVAPTGSCQGRRAQMLDQRGIGYIKEVVLPHPIS